jgi:predicted ArsR family transcriptional regulator
MKTVRLQVLEFIRSHKLVTTTDISRGLKMTPANARHHLEILMSQGLVEIIGKRPSTGKGRPSLTYGISKHTLGHNLDRLASALLLEIDKSNPNADRDSSFQAVAKQMLAPIREEEYASSDGYEQVHLTKRLVNTVQRLNNWHYYARWEIVLIFLYFTNTRNCA